MPDTTRRHSAFWRWMERLNARLEGTDSPGRRPPLLARGPIYRFVRHVFVDRLTDGGKVLFWIIVLSMGAGQTTLVMQIHLVFCCSVGLLLTSVVAARLARPRLHIEAPLPHSAVAGSLLRLPIHVTNVGQRAALDLVVSESLLPREVRALPEAGVGCSYLAVGATWTGQRTLEFTRRGRYTLPGVRQQTLFPCGLWADLLEHAQPRTLRVYPAWSPLEHLHLPQGAGAAQGSHYVSMARGDSTEFLGVRPYRTEDNVKAIHPKTWARLGFPAVKELHQEHTARVCLLLDTWLPTAKDPACLEAFEASLSLTAAVADALSRHGYVLELFATGPGPDSLQTEGSITDIEEVLDILACLTPCVAHPGPGVFGSLTTRIHEVGIAFVLLQAWDEQRDHFVQALVELGVAVKVVIVQADGTTRVARSTSLADGDFVTVTSSQIRGGLSEL